MIFIVLIFAQLSITNPHKAVIKIQTAVKDTYLLITKSSPLTFEITGPTWIRIYTRIPWKKEFGKTAQYKLILVKDDTDEKFITKLTEISKNAYLNGIRVSKWRSFYVNIPDGKHKYEIYLWKAPADTVLAKINFEAPKNYKEITPGAGYRQLEIIENEKMIKYYRFDTKNPLKMKIEGPAKLKISVRIPLKSGNEQATCTITVTNNGKTLKEFTFIATPSDVCQFKDTKDEIPSRVSHFTINLRKGVNNLEFNLRGTESALIRLQVQQ